MSFGRELLGIFVLMYLFYGICLFVNFNFGWSYKHFGMVESRRRSTVGKLIAKMLEKIGIKVFTHKGDKF